METADNLAKVFSKSINKEIQVKTIILQLLCNQISLLDACDKSKLHRSELHKLKHPETDKVEQIACSMKLEFNGNLTSLSIRRHINPEERI